MSAEPGGHTAFKTDRDNQCKVDWGEGAVLCTACVIIIHYNSC